MLKGLDGGASREAATRNSVASITRNRMTDESSSLGSMVVSGGDRRLARRKLNAGMPPTLRRSWS